MGGWVLAGVGAGWVGGGGMGAGISNVKAQVRIPCLRKEYGAVSTLGSIMHPMLMPHKLLAVIREKFPGTFLALLNLAETRAYWRELGPDAPELLDHPMVSRRGWQDLLSKCMFALICLGLGIALAIGLGVGTGTGTSIGLGLGLGAGIGSCVGTAVPVVLASVLAVSLVLSLAMVWVLALAVVLVLVLALAVVVTLVSVLAAVWALVWVVVWQWCW